MTGGYRQDGVSPKMIYCCGKYLKPDRVINIDDNWCRANQTLEIVYCPSHRGLVAELTYFDLQTFRTKTYRPKREKTQEFINKCQRGGFLKKLKVGTKANQAWTFGVNVHKHNKICQFAEDFNGTRKLIKEIKIQA